jgi:CRP/FNR family cyclic AMP-dependent transcriptional regulator
MGSRSRLGQLSFDIVAFNAKFGGVTRSKHAENHSVHRQGTMGDAVFHILEGGVKLTVVSAKGKERVVAILGAGDFFGQTSLISQQLRIASAVTITKCEIVRLELSAIASAVREDLSFSTFFVSFLLGRNARLMDDLVAQLFHSSEQRLARLLLLLADHQGDSQFATLSNQDTLAKMVGTTRSRVNFFMNKFRRLGFIDYNGRIEIHRSRLKTVLQGQSLHA